MIASAETPPAVTEQLASRKTTRSKSNNTSSAQGCSRAWGSAAGQAGGPAPDTRGAGNPQVPRPSPPHPRGRRNTCVEYKGSTKTAFCQNFTESGSTPERQEQCAHGPARTGAPGRAHGRRSPGRPGERPQPNPGGALRRVSASPVVTAEKTFLPNRDATGR